LLPKLATLPEIRPNVRLLAKPGIVFTAGIGPAGIGPNTRLLARPGIVFTVCIGPAGIGLAVGIWLAAGTPL
jgi:hypothetical protein